jgi:inositol-phosphate phosphatase/L-galactose 1-phosphate phosphatase/histidinol-phosphatase
MMATTASKFFLHAAAFRNADQPPVVGGIPKWADVEKNNPSPSSPSPLLPNADTAESSSSQLDEFAAFAHQLANAARKEIAPYWRRGRHVLGQEIKLEEGRSEFQSASPVTLADRAAERVMRDLITSTFPDHGIYGEEYGIKDADADWVWVLDPIDGTRSFITGKPLFGTLISLLHKGTPVIGIIDQFVLNERWLGIAGKQSTLNGAPIRTDGARLLSDAEMYSTTPDMFQKGDALTKFDAMRRAVRTAHYGADCYAYALVASGFGADLVLEADLGLYDYCSLVPILQGAGGVISDWSGESLTLANHDKCKGRVLASANPVLHRQALDILNAQTSVSSVVGDISLAAADDVLLSVLHDNSSNRHHSNGITPWICGVMLGEAIAHYAP